MRVKEIRFTQSHEDTVGESVARSLQTRVGRLGVVRPAQ